MHLFFPSTLMAVRLIDLSPRRETEDMFYHGFENYMVHAFPEDELRPVSCKPLTRDAKNPNHVELNDVLGNYSLTLIDSLSTLAILASSAGDPPGSNNALELFQEGVWDLVEQYGAGEGDYGLRARGFDLDSKIQVFETVIRGVGGLLSAHLFAVGDLPINGYHPREDEVARAKMWEKSEDSNASRGIMWSNGFEYDGQLLRLAYDLAERLLPAFYTPTGLPYPRVNLRHGVPFYTNSPLNTPDKEGQCYLKSQAEVEITETCSAGAGSLVLEFSTLSRLTGDYRFEEAAKRAFWAVWSRRSNAGLIGSGVDAESGLWISPYTGIGAGIDSFFEYALKSHILLSRDSVSNPRRELSVDPFGIFEPLSDGFHHPDSFLHVWEDAHSAIKRHLYRGPNYQHPHYVQGDLYTGAIRATWIDSLSAYYPGLLVLAGEVDEAVETHLLTTALWTRFSALPERWNVATGNIEGGLGWWGGRPEFIESTYHLYRATEDPWYLHVGEMVLRDIKRRCWTRCGWSGLQDVRTGDKNDRMESFFLGETAKYLFLLFDQAHPLNHWDAPWVFTTEGHPLVIPKAPTPRRHSRTGTTQSDSMPTCPAPPPKLPFSASATAARSDIFHASSLARLHLMPSRGTVESPLVEFSSDHPSISLSDLHSPTNHTYYPWTLPLGLVPWNGTSAAMTGRPTFDISFPALPNMVHGPGNLQRVNDGILINSVGGLRLGMIQDVPVQVDDISGDGDIFRIHMINNLALGKDEKIYLSNSIVSTVLNPQDPNLTKVKDPTMLDIVIDIDDSPEESIKLSSSASDGLNTTYPLNPSSFVAPNSDSSLPSGIKTAISSLFNHVSSMLLEQSKSIQSTTSPRPSKTPHATTSGSRIFIPAIIPTGPGTAPIPDAPDISISPANQPPPPLPLTRIHHLTDSLCSKPLDRSIPLNHQIITVPRGGCSFSDKLRNIPAIPPSSTSLQLVIVISHDQDQEQDENLPAGWLIRPLLEKRQETPGGLPRRNPVPMVMVGGGDETEKLLRRARGMGIRRRYEMRARGVAISNLIIV
jgi:hypothetical protein